MTCRILLNRGAPLFSCKRGRLGVSLAILLFVARLSAGSELPSIPELTESDLQQFAPFLRQELVRAYKRLEANPKDLEANGQLGVLLHAYDQNDLALICFERGLALARRPSPGTRTHSTTKQGTAWKWAYYAGSLQFGMGREERAVVYLREAVRLNPGYLAARLKLAESLLQTGQWEESREAFQAVLKRYPDSAQAYYGLGRIEAATSQTGKAAESLAQACRLFPGFGAAHYALAMAYRDLGRESESRHQLSLFQRNPNGRPLLKDPLMADVQALKSGARFSFNEGVRLQKNNQPTQAIAAFERALKADPQFAPAHAALLSVHLSLGQLEEAEKHYHAGVRIDPEMFEVHHDFGIILRRREQIQEAADLFRKALEINPFYADSHNNLGFVLADQGLFAEAERHFRLALENQPGMVFSHFELAKVLQAQGKEEEAIHHLLQTRPKISVSASGPLD